MGTDNAVPAAPPTLISGGNSEVIFAYAFPVGSHRTRLAVKEKICISTVFVNVFNA